MFQELLACRGHLQQSVVLHLLLQVACDEGLTDNRIPDLIVVIGTCTEEILCLVVMRQNLVSLLTDDEINDIVRTEVLLDGEDGIERGHQLILRLDLRLGVQTVVTVATVVLVIDLTEVVQQHLSAADGGLCIGSGLYEQLTADILLSHGLTLHELIELLQVLVGIEGQTDALTTVTPCTTRLLIVAFQRLGDIIVDHKAYIGLVDTHTEGDGSHDHVDVLHQEGILCLGTGRRIETCMVGRSLDLVSPEDGSKLLHLLTRETVDDTALVRVLFDELDDILVHILGLRTYLVIEVRTVKRTLELRGVDNTEVLLDVRTHLVSSSSREGDDRCRTYLVDNRTDTTVLRTEVVSPL